MDLTWDSGIPKDASGNRPTLTVDFPQGAISCNTPDISYQTNCVNCETLDPEIFDVATDGSTLSSFTDFTTPAPLPNGAYEIEMISGLEDDSIESLSGGDSFPYKQETGVGTVIAFTVPEPGSAVTGMAAIVALVSLRRRRISR